MNLTGVISAMRGATTDGKTITIPDTRSKLHAPAPLLSSQIRNVLPIGTGPTSSGRIVMALSKMSDQCYEGPVKAFGLTFFDAADHESCPVGQTTPGVMGGWVCSCPCHRENK